MYSYLKYRPIADTLSSFHSGAPESESLLVSMAYFTLLSFVILRFFQWG